MHKSAEELFAAALVLTNPADRVALLDRECAGNPALRAEVEPLLAAHEQARNFLENPPAAVVAETLAATTGTIPVTEQPGDNIDRYKLLQKIGEGGCGVVYMAEQEKPIRRRVALKVIKLGMDTRQVIARFEAERQALAMMDHPNIAKIFDAGVTEQPLTARGQDMGNKVGIDMGNSFQFICGPFRGHVIEGPYSIHPTPAIREVGLEGPTKHGAIVSVVSHQPQMRLQMEASIRTTWSARTAGSAAPSGALAPANEPRMVEADSADEAAASQLGNSQTASSIAQGIQRARGSGSAHDWPLAPKDETQRPSSSTDSARTADEPWEVDWSWPKQPRTDGGFQRVVSNTRWAAGRTVDSAGPVQPLPAEYPIVARSTVGAGAKNLFAIVWTLRLPGGHPRGQRRTVWIDWPSGSFAIERLVDSIGDFGGIHRARPSRTECWARTNASSVEGRADSAALEQPAGAATTDRSVGRGVQPASASRSAGAENSLRALPSTSSGPEEEQHEISAGMVGAEGAEQRADQVARTKAICGGSLRWVSRGFEAGQKEMGDVFWAI